MEGQFDLFSALTMICGLCLFLFGMNVMGDGLERRAGSGLRTLLGKLTENKIAGFLTGLGVTAVIQSSSATTVMVVGFVNSGMMTLKQAINVIIGANVGTTITGWIVSLTGIGDGNIVMQLLKPSSWTPVLALIGLVFYMFCKSDSKNGADVDYACPLACKLFLWHKEHREQERKVNCLWSACQEESAKHKNRILYC